MKMQGDEGNTDQGRTCQADEDDPLQVVSVDFPVDFLYLFKKL